MNKILLPEVEEVSYKVNIETFVKNQCKPEKANDKIVSLIKYNLSKGSIRIHRLYIGLKPVTNNFCYRKIIMYFFYTQLAEINHEKIYKIKEKQQTEMLSKEERQFLNLANDYKKQLETVLSDFKVPDIYLDGQTIEDLAANEMVVPFITGTITGKYPNTMVLNNVVKNASSYYDILRTPITQNKRSILVNKRSIGKGMQYTIF